MFSKTDHFPNLTLSLRAIFDWGPASASTPWLGKLVAFWWTLLPNTKIDLQGPGGSLSNLISLELRLCSASRIRCSGWPGLTAPLQFRWLAQPLPHGLFVGEILVFLLFRGKLTKHANHGMRQDAVESYLYSS